MVAQRRSQRMSVDEWRALQRAHPDAKYEYIDGQVYFMSGGSLAHARIGSNVVRALEDALEGRSCYVYNSDASVRLSEERYVFPDATVSCNPADLPATELIEIKSPCVVVEVLSESTEGIDRLKKSLLYQACPTIQEYVLVATRYQAVEVQRRVGDLWTIHVFGFDDTVELTSLDASFPIDKIYRGTTVPVAQNE